MAKRSIVHIDEEKCNGCGLCIPSCAEGAIKIIDGKARLVADKYCDGLGACLGECPQGAITIIEREAEEFDEQAVQEHLNRLKKEAGNDENNEAELRTENTNKSRCPGSCSMTLEDLKKSEPPTYLGEDVSVNIKSQLKHWPVQLMLVPVEAPYFNDVDLLITADCVAVAFPNYHLELLKGKSVVMGCPKLDDSNYYVKKLSAILSHNKINSITVAHMEVPCCFGLLRVVEEAIRLSGKNIPIKDVKISIEGNVIE